MVWIATDIQLQSGVKQEVFRRKEQAGGRGSNVTLMAVIEIL
jgi:hypothetical protein